MFCSFLMMKTAYEHQFVEETNTWYCNYQGAKASTFPITDNSGAMKLKKLYLNVVNF